MLYDYACLVAATATAATTFFVAFVIVVAATAAATIMPAEELLDLLGRSIMDFLDRADEVEVFACQGVVEVEYDDFFLDLEDAPRMISPSGVCRGSVAPSTTRASSLPSLSTKISRGSSWTASSEGSP